MGKERKKEKDEQSHHGENTDNGIRGNLSSMLEKEWYVLIAQGKMYLSYIHVFSPDPSLQILVGPLGISVAFSAFDVQVFIVAWGHT